MTTSVNLWVVIGLYLLAAALAPITTRLFKTFKNKIFIVSICLLNLILCSQISVSGHWPPWNYLSVALAFGGGITLFFIPRQIFHKAVVLFLVVQACLISLLFSNHITVTVTLTILSGLLTSIPFFFSSQAYKSDSLTSILLWHRSSDLLLLFSITAWRLNISIDICASLFLLGIFIRTSPLILTTSLQSHLHFISPAARTFYFFSMGFGSYILFFKSNLFFLIPEKLKLIFAILYIFSALFALISVFLRQNSLSLRTNLAFLWISLFYIATLTNHSNVALVFMLVTCMFFPFLFNWRALENHAPIKEESLWRSLILSGWRVDSLMEKIYLKTTSSLAYFTREIIAPTIYILWIQIPQILAAFVRIVLRLLNAGGAQKAITVVLLALTLLLIYYAGI